MAVTELPAWRALQAHKREMEKRRMRDLFAADPHRFERYSLQLGDLLFDYSKNLITDETMALLFQLAREAGVPQAIEAMFSGAKLNTTEKRAVLHVALRNRSNRPIYVDGQDVMPAVNAVLEKMRRFVNEVRSGQRRGFTGKPFTDVVGICIGGSHLGPRMLCRSLEPYADGKLRVHFVTNVDPTNITRTLRQVPAETTLFVVASKSFTTQETMVNAQTARRWLVEQLGDEAAVAHHFVAVSTNAKAVRAFGIGEENMFEFWEWVGGRFSMWSAIGLPAALYLGMERFEEVLAGAHAADEHFRTAPLERNIPVIMGLLGVWYINFWDADTHAILPYDDYLAPFCDYMQQIDTESNGKSVTKDGQPVRWNTGPIVWGYPGTDAQHSFFQLLHQGPRLVPCDFFVAAQPPHPVGNHHDVLVAHCFAQSKALMEGKTEEEARAELLAAGVDPADVDLLAKAKTFPGNRPSNTFLYKRLTPHTLGMLCALYEHKVFVQGTIWNINSFDQMGVELGKQLAGTILPKLTEGPIDTGDSSTDGLIAAYRRWRAG
ncbi:MAG: glucose-6-phosphate isomerase [Bacillota bacterium]|nr:glucose-6-phosphate isomerase [Bacillota bacterium]